MHDPRLNKLGFVARVHERRLREIERRLGLDSGVNPLQSSTDHQTSDRRSAVEPQHHQEPRHDLDRS